MQEFSFKKTTENFICKMTPFCLGTIAKLSYFGMQLEGTIFCYIYMWLRKQNLKNPWKYSFIFGLDKFPFFQSS